ncbi:hypothetical protein CLOSTMETH_00598 [[Clostridium] methylpentosum DSM 5476]|uniref:Uncharacterized protein n=1 Tax=[Clostridium] methylpentosum DSM 5476 TaxID=537013 RepID=C0E9U7_9FIRM|nr:hypothetical protein CLOSTMETH_00598 [[Clostridium] methylpentosum DSM 5476]
MCRHYTLEKIELNTQHDCCVFKKKVKLLILFETSLKWQFYYVLVKRNAVSAKENRYFAVICTTESCKIKPPVELVVCTSSKRALYKHTP